MSGWSAGALLLTVVSVTACGGGEVAEDDAEAAVRAVAERYYDAFRTQRLDEACALVAEETLESDRIVGANVRDDEIPEAGESSAPLTGCALVRARRRGWDEPIPRSAWEVEAVVLDAERVRARVDTSAEGSYWMRRSDTGWRIVGFGWLTGDGLRALGGKWPPGVVIEK